MLMDNAGLTRWLSPHLLIVYYEGSISDSQKHRIATIHKRFSKDFSIQQRSTWSLLFARRLRRCDSQPLCPCSPLLGPSKLWTLRSALKYICTCTGNGLREKVVMIAYARDFLLSE